MADRIKIEHNYKTGEHKETNLTALAKKPKRFGSKKHEMAEKMKGNLHTKFIKELEQHKGDRMKFR